MTKQHHHEFEDFYPGTSLKHYATPQDGLLFVFVEGVLDETVQAFTRRELDAAGSEVAQLLIDCRDVDLVVEAGLAALMAIDALAAERGLSLSVLNAPRAARRRLAPRCPRIEWLD